MTHDDIRRAFLEDLVSVAPDIDPITVRDTDHLQDDLEIDSMDFLNLIAALHRRFGLAIPEPDYPQLATPAKAVRYLAEHLA
ncbi:MAG: acyl carrier protein [Paracoccaceae bacterium]|nr:acyl carrier protein [Paracoccaceae bacterium]